MGLKGLSWTFSPISTTLEIFNWLVSFLVTWLVVVMFLLVEYWILEFSLMFWGGFGSLEVVVILEFTAGLGVFTKLILCFNGDTEGVLSSYLILVGVKPPILFAILDTYGT